MKTEKAVATPLVAPAAPTPTPVKAIASKPAAKSAAVKKPVITVAAVKPATPRGDKVAPKVAPKAAPKVAAKTAPKAAPKAASKSPAKPAVKPALSQKRVATKVEVKAISPIVRDSFTMTAADQELLKKCKRDAVTSGRDSTKKSEIVRAALRHFASLAASTQLMELNGLDPVKTGRPKKK